MIRIGDGEQTVNWFCWFFSGVIKVYKSTNRYERVWCISFEHFRIWSSALWWLNEICNQPKPLCIRAQFSKLLHFLHIPEERSSKQCTAVGDFAGALIIQKWSLFSPRLSYSWMNLNFTKKSYIWTKPYVQGPVCLQLIISF